MEKSVIRRKKKTGRRLAVLVMILMSFWKIDGKNLNECPKWVQQAGKCAPFTRILKDANEYRIILKQEYQIISANYKDGYIYAKVKRHSLESQFRIGKFQLISSVKVEDGLIIVSYDKNKVIVEDASWTEIFTAFGGGYIAGVLTVVIIIAL